MCVFSWDATMIFADSLSRYVHVTDSVSQLQSAAFPASCCFSSGSYLLRGHPLSPAETLVPRLSPTRQCSQPLQALIELRFLHSEDGCHSWVTEDVLKANVGYSFLEQSARHRRLGSGRQCLDFYLPAASNSYLFLPQGNPFCRMSSESSNSWLLSTLPSTLSILGLK